MEHETVAVVSPPSRVYRVTRRGRDPFSPPPWDRVGPDGTFGNRFDDPSAERGLTVQQRFRAVYCATTPEGAFGESVARFRPSIALLAALETINDAASPELEGRTDVGSETLGASVVPADWRLRRLLVHTQLEPTLRLVDFAAPKTHQYLRRALAPTISALGLDDFDLSAIIGPHRALTQRCARAIYDRRKEDGTPMFAGVRYLSRLNPGWECWAIFSDRLVHTAGSATAIASDNPDLLMACKLFNLRVETSFGQ